MKQLLRDSLRVPETRDTFGPECPTKAGHFLGDKASARYARLPLSVLTDETLNLSSLRVYCALSASVFRGKQVANVGIRQMAQMLGVGKSSVARAMNALIKRGHIALEGSGKGHRAQYRLTSPVFEAKAEKREVVLNVCGKCGKRRKVNKTGYCEGCRIQSEVERRMRHLA